jgi:thiamine biosynthesis lipoprotein
MPVRSRWRTVTVVAQSCVKANAYAAGAIVMGAIAETWLASLHAPARLVDLDGQPVELTGFPREPVV